MSDHIEKEFNIECGRLVASIALSGSEALPMSKRIMVAHGLTALFPDGSAEREATSKLEATLKEAEESQLHLTEIINPPAQP